MTAALPVRVVLGIDQGARAGWALMDVRTRTVIASGIATRQRHIIAAVELALEHARTPAELLVMFEDHSAMPLKRKTRGDAQHHGAPERSTASILGQGEAKGWWTAELERIDHPDVLRDKVEPRVWRSAVLSVRRMPDVASYKRLSVAAANAATGHKVIADHNEAEALHIARYGVISGVLLLEHRRRQRRATAQARKRQQLALTGTE